MADVRGQHYTGPASSQPHSVMPSAHGQRAAIGAQIWSIETIPAEDGHAKRQSSCSTCTAEFRSRIPANPTLKSGGLLSL